MLEDSSLGTRGYLDVSQVQMTRVLMQKEMGKWIVLWFHCDTYREICFTFDVSWRNSLYSGSLVVKFIFGHSDVRKLGHLDPKKGVIKIKYESRTFCFQAVLMPRYLEIRSPWPRKRLWTENDVCVLNKCEKTIEIRSISPIWPALNY